MTAEAPGATLTKLSKKDFTSDQEVRWCPGCGDYAILATVQRLMPDLGVKRENTVFVSGIGCSSRFPYYMNTFGFHTIHGRAPAIATGMKLANPGLDIWLATGDGDGLSIGGNHLLHVIRRNVDIHMMLFNNRIYGLTKGQYSPTSLIGQKSPSTPLGSVDPPLLPAQFALGANGRFVARAVDTQAGTLGEVLKRAHEHRGCSFVEILQNCPVYNDGTWDNVTEKSVASEQQLWVEHGKPLVWGKNKDKGLKLREGGLALEPVTIGQNGTTERDILVHDETNRSLAFLLAGLEPPSFPIALGVLYDAPAPTYNDAVHAQIAHASGKLGPGDVDKLLRSGHTWTVSS